MFLHLRILNELRGSFSEVRILQGLRLGRLRVGWGLGTETAAKMFELMIEVTRRRITHW